MQPMELRKAVLKQITENPETHDQMSWFRCVGGWAIKLAGMRLDEYGCQVEPSSIPEEIRGKIPRCCNGCNGTRPDMVAGFLLGINYNHPIFRVGRVPALGYLTKLCDDTEEQEALEALKGKIVEGESG